MLASTFAEGYLMTLIHSNFLGPRHFADPVCGFRPIICLKSDVNIKGDGTIII